MIVDDIISEFANYLNDLWKHLFRHLFIYQLICIFIYLFIYIIIYIFIYSNHFFKVNLILFYIILSSQLVIAQKTISGMEKNVPHAQAAPMGLVWRNLVQKPKTPNVNHAFLAMITRTAQGWRSASSE